MNSTVARGRSEPAMSRRAPARNNERCVVEREREFGFLRQHFERSNPAVGRRPRSARPPPSRGAPTNQAIAHLPSHKKSASARQK